MDFIIYVFGINIFEYIQFSRVDTLAIFILNWYLNIPYGMEKAVEMYYDFPEKVPI